MRSWLMRDASPAFPPVTGGETGEGDEESGCFTALMNSISCSNAAVAALKHIN